MLTQRDSPLRLAGQPVEAPIANERRNKRANPQHELLQRRQAPPDARVRDLRLVQRREHREHADAHPSEEPPAVHVVDVLRRCLERAADEEDDAAGEDGEAAPDRVGERADVDVRRERAEEEASDDKPLRGGVGVPGRGEEVFRGLANGA